MVSNPEEVALQYVDAGADILTFHIEAVRNAYNLVSNIKKSKIKVGVAINPDTSLDRLSSVCRQL